MCICLDACCCASCLSCCVVDATCSVCECCGRAIPCTPSQKAKGWYSTLFFCVTIAVWVVSVWASEILGWVPAIKAAEGDCVDTESTGVSCASVLAVYQVTWSLFIFHFLLSVSLVGVKDTESARAHWHTQCWCVKLLLYLVLFVTSFLIPYTFISVFKWFALLGAIVFIFLQLFLLIDFAHTLNEVWVGKHTETGGRTWVLALVSTSLFSYMCALAFIIVSYIFYSHTWTGPLFATLGLVLSLFVSALSLTPSVQNAERSTPVGVLQSGIVSAYASYLVLSGLMSQGDGIGLLSLTIIGTIFVLVSVVSSSLTVSSSISTFVMKNSDLETPLLVQDKEAIDPKEPPYNYSFFHFTFALGALYVCMLMTNWDLFESQEGSTSGLVIDSGAASMWVKEVASWMVYLLYAWTLVAPLALPDRAW